MSCCERYHFNATVSRMVCENIFELTSSLIPNLFIVDGAVFGEVLVFAASPAQQDHNWLLCPLPVPL